MKKNVLSKLMVLCLALLLVVSTGTTLSHADWKDMTITLEGCYREGANEQEQNLGYVTLTQADFNQEGDTTFALVVTDATKFQKSVEAMTIVGEGPALSLIFQVKYVSSNKSTQAVDLASTTNTTLGSESDKLVQDLVNNTTTGWLQGGWNTHTYVKAFHYGLVNQVPDKFQTVTGWFMTKTTAPEDTQNLLEEKYTLSKLRNGFTTNNFGYMKEASEHYVRYTGGSTTGVHQIVNNILRDEDEELVSNSPQGILAPTVQCDFNILYTFDIAPVTDGYMAGGFTLGSLDQGTGTLKSNIADVIAANKNSTLAEDPNKDNYKSGEGLYDGELDIDLNEYPLGTGIATSTFNRKTNALDAQIVDTYNGAVNSRGYNVYGTTLPTTFNGTDSSNPFKADKANHWVVDYVDITVYDPATGLVKTHEKLSETEAVAWLGSNTLGGRTEVRVAYKQLVDIFVTKQWTGLVGDDFDYTSRMPREIFVRLLANGTEIDSDKANESTDWSVCFLDYDKLDENGEEIVYTVVEDEVYGFESEVSGSVDEGFVIVNEFQRTDITITKVWKDRDNAKGERPDTIIVHLFADGKEVDRFERIVMTGTEFVAENLPLYDTNTGEEIVYTVTEEPVEGYQTKIDGLTITNTYNDIPDTGVFSNTWMYFAASAAMLVMAFCLIRSTKRKSN